MYSDEAKELVSANYSDSQEQKNKIETIRDSYAILVTCVMDNMESSRERSLALTKIEESCMWAIKGITREKQG